MKLKMILTQAGNFGNTHAGLELELDDKISLEEFGMKMDQTFETMKASVSKAVGPMTLPDSFPERKQIAMQPSTKSPNPASEKQLQFLRSLLGKAGISLEDWMAQHHYPNEESLTRKQCFDSIAELKNQLGL